MAIRGASRVQVVEVIREAAGHLRRTSILPGKGTSVSEALATACSRSGVSPEAYDAAVAADPELAALQKAALGEALVGSTDPGPNDAISREAATGQPGDHAINDGQPGAVKRSDLR